MKIHSLKLIFLTTIIALPIASLASVSKISFTTEPQTIRPNDISGAITIQSQDSSGNASQVAETFDLEFKSSSPTGEFLNSGGNPATGYMSKNTANRTFYYRDSAAGTFTITVNAAGRDTGLKLAATQQIKISSDSSAGSGGAILMATADSGESSDMSATSGAATPSYYSAAAQLQVSAGADRLTAPGSPISFQARIVKNSIADSAVTFSWSFGDGNVDSGPLVTHMYKYPGEYAVVLNAKAGDIFAVSRVKVKAVAPELSLQSKDGYIEISNDSDYEVNLFNWKLVSAGKSFIFQPDTIVLPKSSIKVDESLLALRGEAEQGISLKNFLGQEVAKSGAAANAVYMKDVMAKTEEIKRQAYSVMDQAISAQLVSEVYPYSDSQQMDYTGQAKGTSTAAKAPASSTPKSDENILYQFPKREWILTRAWHFLQSMLR